MTGLTGHFFIFDDDHAVKPVTGAEWVEFMTTGERVLGDTAVSPDVRVSTVFLGYDGAFGLGEPRYFETMVLGGPLDEHIWRWTTWDAAKRGHRNVVARARRALRKAP